MKDWPYLAIILFSLLFVTAISFIDERQPMTQAQINAAFAKQVQR